MKKPNAKHNPQLKPHNRYSAKAIPKQPPKKYRIKPQIYPKRCA